MKPSFATAESLDHNTHRCSILGESIQSKILAERTHMKRSTCLESQLHQFTAGLNLIRWTLSDGLDGVAAKFKHVFGRSLTRSKMVILARASPKRPSCWINCPQLVESLRLSSIKYFSKKQFCLQSQIIRETRFKLTKIQNKSASNTYFV